ncbi:MAG: sulfatase-like hydrolase/transferase, partial [Planctomycetota bacterium]
GGIGQPSDPIGAEGKYTDPTLFRNGEQVEMKGYCTDLYFDAAMELIADAAKSNENFFTYIATNAPHGPFHDVPGELYEQYLEVDFSPIVIGKPKPARSKSQFDKLARIAAMITNIDDNVGRLFARLESLGVADNTIVVYLNDNGPNTRRYVGEMRGMKTEVDDGGIRSPLLFHWPAKIKPGATSHKLCAHIDVLPTILDACGLDLPSDACIDGRSFLPLLVDGDAEWPKRHVVFQSHRGDVPQLYNHFAIHQAPWKLVHPSGFGNEQIGGEPKLELYHLGDDPRQQEDLAAARPEVVRELKKAYETWFADVSSTRDDNFAPPRIVVGTEHEPETVLTRQDWRHAAGKPWAADSNGAWLLEVAEEGPYQVEVILDSDRHPAASATVRYGSASSTF